MSDFCHCAGCVKCTPPCPNKMQTGVQFADYCRACHRSHLCSRCGSNAIASTSVESFCSTCLSSRSSWCACTGCKAHGGPHDNHCPMSKQNNKRFAGYCTRCASRWKCPSCGAILPNCPTGDLVIACQSCRPPQCSCQSFASHVSMHCSWDSGVWRILQRLCSCVAVFMFQEEWFTSHESNAMFSVCSCC